MDGYATVRLDGPAIVELPRRHRWLIASAAAHVVLAAWLVTAGPVRVAVKRDEGVRARVEQSLRQTAQREVQRELRTMEKIRDALEKSAGGAGSEGNAGKDAADGNAKAADPAARARALAAQIEAVQQKIRAAEMARVLRIPEAEALRRVRAEQARKPRPAPPKNAPPEAQVAQLVQQARAALAQRRAQLLAQQQGVALKPPGGEAHSGKPQGGQGPDKGKGSGKTAGQGGLGRGQGQGQGQGKGQGQGQGQGSGQGGPVGLGGQGGRAGGGGTNENSAARYGYGTVEALATGLALGAPGAITGGNLDMSSSAFSDSRSFGAYVTPPPVDLQGMRAGRGRTIGAGGPYANRVFLDAWYVIGPFQGASRDSQGAVYPPERGVDLDAVYFGKNSLPVRWTFQQDASYPTVPLPRAENAVYYAYTEVEIDRDTDLWVSIGADDDSKLWFNDDLVWISSTVDDKPWYRQPFFTMNAEIAALNLTEGRRRLHFHKGRNTLLFKLYNGADLMFFSVVLSK
jgi:hypothetical protein